MSRFLGATTNIENLPLVDKQQLMEKKRKMTDSVLASLQEMANSSDEAKRESLTNLISSIKNGSEGELADVINGAYARKIINPGQFLDLTALILKETNKPNAEPIIVPNDLKKQTEVPLEPESEPATEPKPENAEETGSLPQAEVVPEEKKESEAVSEVIIPETNAASTPETIAEEKKFKSEEIDIELQQIESAEGFNAGDKIIWDGKEEVIKNNDGQWISFESGPIVSLEAIKESLKPKVESTFDKEVELASKIRDAKNFDELYETLREVGGIQGSDKFYDTEDLISFIDHYRKFPGDIILSAITRSGGLREKVKELFSSENLGATPPVPETTTEPVSQPAPTPQPESVPVSEPLLTPESVSAAQEENIPEWKQTEEWKNFEMMREDLVRYETSINQSNISSINLELKRSEYRNYKEAIAKKIEESLIREAGENLTPEQETQLKQKIHDTVNKELLDKEQDSYRKVLQKHREETLMDKTKETIKSALNSKVMQWYLNLPKWQRITITTILGTGVGIAAGAAGALGVAGYSAFRVSRAAASFGGASLGSLIGEKNKSWSLEELEKKEQEEKKVVEDSNKSWEEKSKEFEEIEKKYEKQERNIKLKKAALTVGIGAGAGLLTGLSEHILGGVNKPSVLEQTSRPRNLDDHIQGVKPKVSGPQPVQIKMSEETSRIEPEQFKVIKPESIKPSYSEVNPEQIRISNSDFNEVNTPKPLAPESVKASVPETPVKTPSPLEEIERIRKSSPPPEPIKSPIPDTLNTDSEGLNKIFENLENIKHIKIEGQVNSFWNAVKKGLSENKNFENLTEAQKQNVVSFYTNKGIGNPLKFNLTPDQNFGVRVEAGKEVDLSKLFGDPEELHKIINRAGNLTKEQQDEMLERSAKISAFLADEKNKGMVLNQDKVSEILSYKPKIVEPVKVSMPENLEPAFKVEPVKASVPEALEPPFKVEPVKTSMQETLDKEISEMTKENLTEKIPGPESLQSGYDETLTSSGAGIAGAAALGKLNNIKDQERQIHDEIEEAKSRLEVLEGGKKIRTMVGDVEVVEETEKAFRNEINNVYGKSGLFRKVAGIDTKEWGEMARLPASKVVEYYTGDSAKSGLPEDIVEKLSKSAKHSTLIKQVKGLMEHSNGAVKPFEKENMEQFIKRLGGYVLKTNLLQKAA